MSKKKRSPTPARPRSPWPLCISEHEARELLERASRDTSFSRPPFTGRDGLLTRIEDALEARP